MMGTSFEDLVTDSLQHRAAAVLIPANLAGLARHARRQQRRRRYALRSGLTAVTAAGVAVAIPLAATGGPQPARPPLQTQTAAYVVRHSERSIANIAITDIEVARDTYPSPGLGFSPLGTGTVHSTITWSNSASLRQEFFAAADRPMLDQGSVFPAALAVRDRAGSDTIVDYITRTWWRLTLPAMNVKSSSTAPPASCKPQSPVAQLVPLGEWAPSVPWLRYGLRCGTFTLAGRQHVAGINAIKIVSDQVAVREVIWVNPVTYLPVQSLTFGTLADYRWLPATPRNLALFNPPIPAGFRRVKVSPLPG
jgi:hypothetical protein